MSDESPRPRPRGVAAWEAEKQRVAKRNEAAYARGRKEEAERVAAMRRRRIAAERREYASLPAQPGAGPRATG
jgi:hypothetical protein